MIIKKEINSIEDFTFWSGAKDTLEELSADEQKQLFAILEELQEEWQETELNDFIWFERDTIAEWLGYTDFDELMNKDDYSNCEFCNERVEKEELLYVEEWGWCCSYCIQELESRGEKITIDYSRAFDD